MLFQFQNNKNDLLIIPFIWTWAYIFVYILALIKSYL